MKNPKLKAFTVIELIVTLILSGLIIASAMSFYLNYDRLIKNKTLQMNKGKETLQFYHTFSNEFYQCRQMKVTGNQVLFQMPDERIITYNLEDNFIVRSLSQGADTFTLKAINLNYSETLLQDQVISFDLENGNEIFPVLLAKKLSNDLLMNRPKTE